VIRLLKELKDPRVPVPVAANDPIHAEGSAAPQADPELRNLTEDEINARQYKLAKICRKMADDLTRYVFWLLGY
jgi:hypothetical protein